MRDIREFTKVIISTMPRSGTNYLYQFVSELMDLKKIEPKFATGTAPEPPEWDPYKYDKTYMEINHGEILTAHYPLTEELKEIVHAPDVLAIYLFRDPRDAAISAVLYIKNVLKNHCLHDLFNRITEQEALLFMLCGGVVPAGDNYDSAKYIRHDGMRYFCNMSYPWLHDRNIAKIRYEKLTVDPVKTITESLAEIDIEVNEEDLCNVNKRFNFSTVSNGRAKGIEDKTSHYRKGIIGDYRNHFTDIHYAMCKYHLGDDIIKMGYETGYRW